MAEHIIDGVRVKVLEYRTTPEDIILERLGAWSIVRTKDIVINQGTRLVDQAFYDRVYNQLKTERGEPVYINRRMIFHAKTSVTNS